MSSPTPPPVSPPSRKKPSVVATCLLLALIIGVLGAVTGGGYWAYKTFVAKKLPQLTSKQTKPPAPSTSDPKRPSTGPVAKNTPSKTTVIETPTQPTLDPTPNSDPSATATATPSTTPTTAEPTPPVTPPPTPPSTTTAANELKPEIPTEPLPEPPSSPPSTDPGPVVAAEPIQTFAEDSPQVTALKADADRRIDEAPAELYSDADKQRVRDAIRKAKRLTRVATLQFSSGAAALGSNERNRLKKALLSPEAEALLSDPEAVFFILGFADATGASDINRKISQKRAANVSDVLKSFKVTNSSYAVGIGATTLLSAEKQSKNRAAEVWLVLP